MTGPTEAPVLLAPPERWDLSVGTLIIGAGCAGLVAALAGFEAGQDVLVVEADAVPQGSTALSAGLIPAAGTKVQRQAGIDDAPAIFARDIQSKAHDQNDTDLVELLTNGAADALEWLADRHGLDFTLVDDFDYPGHSKRRMHGLPSRSGAELIDTLRARAEGLGIPVICQRRAESLFANGNRVVGAALRVAGGQVEHVRSDHVILACNGFGGNRAMVAEHMPQIADALWFGHDGNRGDAVIWGKRLGAATRHLGAYQGHGNVAHPHGILITWAVITAGGVQVNAHGKRFWDESQGYSEAARHVMAQPGGVAFAIFDDRIVGIARQFADFQQAERQGAVKIAANLEALAGMLGLPGQALAQTLAELPQPGIDAFGRRFDGPPLQPPFCGAQVTGALFHTQGGLVVDRFARVLNDKGHAIQGLFAAGGAACGVSGSGDAGYLSGNGLLSAMVLGRIAGQAAV